MVTLRQRLTAALTLLVLLTCALVAGWSLHVAKREMVATIGTQQFDLLSASAAYLDADVVHMQALLRTVIDGLAGGAPGACGRAQPSIERHTVLRNEFFNVTVFDATGLLIGDMRNPARIGTKALGSRPYFQDTMRSRKGLISEPFVSALSNRPVILITEPVFDSQGNIACILGGSVDLSQSAFFGQISRLRPGRTGYLFALTRDGLILHHPDPSRLLKNVLTEQGTAVSSTVAAMHGWEGWKLGRSKNGTLAIITYKRMRNPEWILGSVYPFDEAFSGVNAAQRAAIIGAALVALCAGLVGWFVTDSLLRPLQRLRWNVVAVEEGRESIEVFNLDSRDEVGALGRALYSLSTKRKEAETKLAHLAMTDALTGLGNRRRLQAEIHEIAATAEKLRTPVTLAFLDVDHFKSINDRLGHDVGDLVLMEFSLRLRAAVKSTDHVFRLAGDEFVIVLEHREAGVDLDAVAHKILDLTRAPFFVTDGALLVTTSIGMATCDWSDVELGALLRCADEALYATKQRGRDGFTLRTCR
ncbi:diguanylate cyclase [Massilia orientalis]|uniref:Diguanylate cyclase domain-containing protein n=1 Tax=Massilia orientalis TaxID=3050128 RepID=A0ACC7MLL1_9BURK|nr:sensor domain-containing diguanylate cyclase [Massilia sp. YIM B02787]